MNKVFIIIAREFITRVRKPTFILMSLLGPVLFGALLIVPTWLTTIESEDRALLIKDESGLLLNADTYTSGLLISFTDVDLEEAKEEVSSGVFSGLLYVPATDTKDPQGVRYFSNSTPSVDLRNNLRNIVNRAVEKQKQEDMGISEEQLRALKADVAISMISLKDQNEAEQNAIVASIIGYATSFLIYIFILLYGIQVMRGVIEEKSNRIVEVILSSVRPFQLMMGKIIGVAAVGLAQFLIWVVLAIGLYTVALNFFAPELAQADLQASSPAAPQAQMDAEAMEMVLSSIKSIDIPLILGSFLVFFLLGYLVYSGLFAALGSATDNDTDSQQFMLPITLPLIVSILVLGAVLKEPDGSLAFWFSMVPLTSPIVMMMRVPFGVPAWELALSISILISFFLLITWLAARIYRVGILFHGSKISYKTLYNWLRYSYR
ncbi:MAG: ABC transporter permease [Cyclobacteriaceae bacterium]|nr:ABC transporter permease [Cyclobacteriaceae bacterium]MCH8516820.1 ABC transporter permease [Cyclobacteriaceae bacterium]